MNTATVHVFFTWNPCFKLHHLWITSTTISLLCSLMNNMDKFGDAVRVNKYNWTSNEDIALCFICIRAVLEGKGIHYVVQGIKEEPQKKDFTEHAVFAEKVSMARRTTVTALGNKALRDIQSTVSPKEILDTLEAFYVVPTPVSKVDLTTALVDSRLSRMRICVTICWTRNIFQQSGKQESCCCWKTCRLHLYWGR